MEVVLSASAVSAFGTFPVTDRRGRPRHVPLELDVMRRSEGRPLTPRELADLSGMSADKICNLLRCGYLHGVPKDRFGRTVNPQTTSRRYQWSIPYLEAQRWLKELRVL